MSSFVLSAFFLSFFPFNRGKRSGAGLQAGMQLFVAAKGFPFLIHPLPMVKFFGGGWCWFVHYLFSYLFLICIVRFVFWITILRSFPEPHGDTWLDKDN